MYILGDIGNTETKMFLVSKKKRILKKITFLSKSVNNKQLNSLFKKNKIQLNKSNLTVSAITKINCLLVKKLLSKFTRKKILFKKPNDLLIEKKKISGILQEIIYVKDKKFLITGIGINIIKNPNITNYPATNLQEISKKSISKLDVENKLKQLFEKNLSKLYKIK